MEKIQKLLDEFKFIAANKHTVNILYGVINIKNDTLYIPKIFKKNYKIKNLFIREIGKNTYQFDDVFLLSFESFLKINKINYYII